MTTPVVHACPADVTPCCGRTLSELPPTDRVSGDERTVTCQVDRLREAGWVHRDEVADRLTAAFRLVQPDHLTPMGARQIRAVVNNWGGEGRG